MKSKIKEWQELNNKISTEKKINQIRKIMEENRSSRYNAEQLNENLLILRGRKC